MAHKYYIRMTCHAIDAVREIYSKGIAIAISSFGVYNNQLLQLGLAATLLQSAYRSTVWSWVSRLINQQQVCLEVGQSACIAICLQSRGYSHVIDLSSSESGPRTRAPGLRAMARPCSGWLCRVRLLHTTGVLLVVVVFTALTMNSRETSINPVNRPLQANTSTSNLDNYNNTSKKSTLIIIIYLTLLGSYIPTLIYIVLGMMCNNCSAVYELCIISQQYCSS